MVAGDVFALMVVVIVPALFLAYMARRFFALKERQLDSNISLAAEKAAQYATDKTTLEARVQVLEKIVTDGGYDTAVKIEALRDHQPRAVKKVGLDQPHG